MGYSPRWFALSSALLTSQSVHIAYARKGIKTKKNVFDLIAVDDRRGVTVLFE